jgi:hypothetical protein
LISVNLVLFGANYFLTLNKHKFQTLQLFSVSKPENKCKKKKTTNYTRRIFIPGIGQKRVDNLRLGLRKDAAVATEEKMYEKVLQLVFQMLQ